MTAAVNGLGSGGGNFPPAWRPLAVFCLYRLLLTGLLLMAALTGAGPHFLGQSHPALFLLTGLTYAAMAIAFGVATAARMGSFQLQVLLQLATDIGFITLLMHTSGGVPSGLGMLLVVVIAVGGILTVGRTASALAALATLAVLFEQAYSLLSANLGTAYFTQAGLLGATLFATALLAQVLAYRIRESEALAAQQNLDLANLSQLNEYIIQRLQSGVLVIDGEDTVRFLNRAAQDLLGLSPGQEGRRLTHVALPLVEQLAQWRQEPGFYRPQAFCPTRDDSTTLLPRFTPLGRGNGTLIFLDDTAAAARQAQQLKLASLGRLTASIAHEIRNPLGAISHAAQLLGESSRLGAGERRLVEILLTHCARVNGIIKNVLQLSCRKPSQGQLLGLQSWLARFRAEFCESKAMDSAAVGLSVDAAEIRVWVDSSQLHQILWNLCDNAWRHARRSAPVPCLHLSAGRNKPHGQAWIEVVDSGPGIAEEIADKMFEPFFTTQRAGTGLGLYIARELAECNGARLEYYPAVGGGSRFRICFGRLETAVNAA